MKKEEYREKMSSGRMDSKFRQIIRGTEKNPKDNANKKTKKHALKKVFEAHGSQMDFINKHLK